VFWRRVLNEELKTFYTSLNVVSGIESRRMAEMRNAHRICVSKPEGKRLLRRPRHRWKDNIRMHIREIVWEVWTGCIWLRLGTTDWLM